MMARNMDVTIYKKWQIIEKLDEIQRIIRDCPNDLTLDQLTDLGIVWSGLDDIVDHLKEHGYV